MIGQHAPSLSLQEAAKIICRTASPSREQLGRVRRELESGALPGRLVGKDQWITSATGVAEYLARRAMHKQRKAHPVEKSGTPELRGVYREILADYFLAVLMRRRLRNASRAFQRAVLAGQVGLLAVLVLGLTLAVRWTIIPSRPEQVVVKNWLQANTVASEVTQWFPAAPNPDGNGVSVRVQYRYSVPGQKSVETDRIFAIVGNEVTSVSSTE